MNIKATRLQAWAPAKVGRRPPPFEKKKILGSIGRLFATFSSYGGLFATFFSFLGAFSPCGDLFATFYFMVGASFWACPPPTKISAGAHDCKEGSRACSPKIFLCDRNLVDMFCYDFALKMTKNNDKL